MLNPRRHTIYAYLKRASESDVLTPSQALHGVWCMARSCPLPLPSHLMAGLYGRVLGKQLTGTVRAVAGMGAEQQGPLQQPIT